MNLRAHIDRILEYVLSLLLAIMVMNVLWQVASRFLLKDPSAFTDELSRYLLIWVGLIGAAYASGKGMHVAIALLERRLSQRLLKAQKLLIQILVLGFGSTVLILGGVRLVYISFHLGQTSSAMQIPLGYVYLALPISGLLIGFYSILDILKLLRSE